MPTLRVALPVIALAVLASACGGSPSGGAPSAAGASKTASTQSCPSPPEIGDRFPDSPAARVPHPAYAVSPSQLPVTVDGEDEVEFMTPTPLSVSAAFVQQAYRAAGYRIVGGDTEAHEADILWAHGGNHGKTRLSGAGCTTTWTVLALRAGSKLHDKG